MSYILLTIFSAFLLSLYDLFKKISTEKITSIYKILFVYTSFSFICSIIFITKAFNITLIPLLFILLKSILICTSWLLTLKSLKKLELGLTLPFSILTSCFVTILSYFIFDDKIGISQIGGIIIILIGLILLSLLQNKDNKKDNNYKYIILLIIASFISSLSAIIDKHVLTNIDYRTYSFWFFLFTSLLYLTIGLFKEKKKLFNIDKKKIIYPILIGITIFLSDIIYYLAIKVDNSSLSNISILRKTSIFFGIILGSIFLKEKHLMKKLLISLVLALGLFIINYL